MLQREVLIGELGGSIDGTASRSISVDKIAALDHEILDYTVKLAPLVALRPSLGVLALPGAELANVLCRPRGDIGKKLYLDSTERLA